MNVSEIVLTVDDESPSGLPRLGEVMLISLPRMNQPTEFTVAQVKVKRNWTNEGGDEDGYWYSGTIRLEAMYEDDDDDGGDDGEENAAPDRVVGSGAPVTND